MNHRIPHTVSGLGLVLSIGCAIHCILMPVLMITFPFFNGALFHNTYLEWAVLTTLVGLGVISLNHYRKAHHNSSLPIRVFSAGAAVFLMALVMPGSHHEILTIGGSSLIAVSHVINLTLKKAVA